jgi:OOP family OmpA-OmpF porin
MRFGAKSFVLSVAVASLGCANGGPNPIACGLLGALAGGGAGAYAGSETPGHDGDEMIGYGAAGAAVLGTAGYLICKAMEEEPAPPPAPAPPPPPPAPRAEVRERIVLRGVNFDFDKSEIRPDAAVILDEAASQLSRRSDTRVAIEGHTDSTGPDNYNQGLSERRAQAVHDYLVDHGVSAGRLSTVGYGESQPVADNSTREGRALNRRVELRVSE